MSVVNTIPAPIIQMGHVEKIVEMAQNQPGVQQQVTQATTAIELKREKEQVTKTDPSADAKKVRDREKKQEKNKQQTAGNFDGEPFEDTDEEPAAPKENPWAGQIVNVKI